MWHFHTQLLYSGWDIRPSFVTSTTANVHQMYHQHAKGSYHWTQWSEPFAYFKAFFMNSRKIRGWPKGKDKRTNTKSYPDRNFPNVWNTLFCVLSIYVYIDTHTASVCIYIHTHRYVYPCTYIYVYVYKYICTFIYV